MPEARRKHRTKPVPPVAHRFMADLDAKVLQQVLDPAQRYRDLNLKHQRQTDCLRAGPGVAERRALRHSFTQEQRDDRFNKSSSDNDQPDTYP